MKRLELTGLGHHVNVGRSRGKALVHQYHSELRLSPWPDTSSQKHYSVEPVRSFRLHREMAARMRLYYHQYATLISIENLWSTWKKVFKDWNKKMYYHLNSPPSLLLWLKYMLDLGSSTAACTKAVITFTVMELAAGVGLFGFFCSPRSLSWVFFSILFHIDFDLLLNRNGYPHWLTYLIIARTF